MTPLPVIEQWAAEVLGEIEAQADRIRAGIACRPCNGSGVVPIAGPMGLSWLECGSCHGTGVDDTKEPITR